MSTKKCKYSKIGEGWCHLFRSEAVKVMGNAVKFLLGKLVYGYCTNALP